MTFTFSRNIGMFDGILRGGIGLAMIYFGFFGQFLITDHIARLILGGMGVGMLFIVIIGYCPLYSLIGFSTHNNKTKTT